MISGLRSLLVRAQQDYNAKHYDITNGMKSSYSGMNGVEKKL